MCIFLSFAKMWEKPFCIEGGDDHGTTHTTLLRKDHRKALFFPEAKQVGSQQIPGTSPASSVLPISSKGLLSARPHSTDNSSQACSQTSRRTEVPWVHHVCHGRMNFVLLGSAWN